LWLLGLDPPVAHPELNRAWRARVAQAHPDLHGASAERAAAANLLTGALNDARRLVGEWIDSGREWPEPETGTAAQTPPAPSSPPPPPPADPSSGFRPGDSVRTWPFDGEPLTVERTERDHDGKRLWVVFAEGGAEPASRVAPAVYSCPVCGLCAGPERERYAVRPCLECVADLHRLDARPGDAPRIRAAIEARAEAGRVNAAALADPDLEQRAVERRRWARRLKAAEPDDLHAALLAAFSRAYERWAGAA
jgi:hypothetical protein